MASSFTADALLLAYTVTGTPALRPAKATPWPWLPEEAVITPCWRCWGVSKRTLLLAPRNLKEPVC
ncbi:hypothetical protein D3C84_1048900 [compost metagenome]